MKSKQFAALGLALALAVSGMATESFAAKKKPSSNGAPSAELRKRAFEQGLKDCRKKWGASLHEVHVEKYYGRWGVVCYHY
jgi:hypothetical protein